MGPRRLPCAMLASVALVLASCSSNAAPETKGRIVVALTIDWEGAYLPQDSLDALADVRVKLGSVPITHFMSAAYFTKPKPEPTAAALVAKAVQPGDELAVHVHAWKSLAAASGITPRLSPSFFTGTDKVVDFEDGDAGFDTDLDTYDVQELRALLQTSRRLLEKIGPKVSTSYRSGGWLTTPKMIEALLAEGYLADSSAIDHHELDDATDKDDLLSHRVAEVWPKIERSAQPFLLRDPLIELPVAAMTDYATAAEIVAILDAAHQRLEADPARDVFVVLGFHFETAPDYADRLADALATVRGRAGRGDELCFVTIEQAAQLARFSVR